jgi:hypothetical protein
MPSANVEQPDQDLTNPPPRKQRRRKNQRAKRKTNVASAGSIIIPRIVMNWSRIRRKGQNIGRVFLTNRIRRGQMKIIKRCGNLDEYFLIVINEIEI